MFESCVLNVSGCVHVCYHMLVVIHHFSMLLQRYDVMDDGKPESRCRVVLFCCIRYEEAKLNENQNNNAAQNKTKSKT